MSLGEKISVLFLIGVVELCCGFFGSCSSDNPLKALPGHYEGTLFETNGLRSENASAAEPRDVSADVVFNSKSLTAHVAIVDYKSKARILDVDLDKIDDGSFGLYVPYAYSGRAKMTMSDGCYHYQSGLGVRFCFANDKITLEVSSENRGGKFFTFYADRFGKHEAIELEPEEDFTLDSAMDRAFQSNFDVLQQYEKVRQARLGRTLARANLLPGLTLPSIIGIIVRDPASIISSVGDLAPFLLPTRWLQAKEADLKNKAEVDAMILLRANIATQVEGFAYVYERDLALREAYVKAKEKATLELLKLRRREFLGQIPGPPYPSIPLNGIVNTLDDAINAFDLAIDEDKAAISLTLGFRNPSVVRKFELPEEEDRPIERAELPDEDDLDVRAESRKRFESDLQQFAWDRSFERRQVDYLIETAQTNGKERYFNWLDPAGDYTGKLGFGLGSYIKIGDSQVDALFKARKAINATLNQDIHATVEMMGNAMHAHKLALRGLAIQTEILNSSLRGISFGTSIDITGLVQTFQDYMAVEVRVATSIASYRTARAKLDRFRHRGFYSRLADFEKSM